jgi:hypothetical protein
MEPRPCFACGGDIPAGVRTTLIANTAAKPTPRRPGQLCRCETPELLLHMGRDPVPAALAT